MAVCPPEDVVVDLLEGRLSDERAAELHDHVDTCAACQALLAYAGGTKRRDDAKDAPTRTAPAPTPSDGSPPPSPSPDPLASPRAAASRDSAAPFREGDVLLEKYVVERVLGQGGMGVVAAVRHVELGELFAMKVLLPRALESRGAMGRFLREARAAARLKGEHAVKVFDVGRLSADTPYMVMEHLNGKDLKDLLRERGPLPAEEAAVYLLQVCEALAEAHSHGIIHRDLKPSNLFYIKRPNGSSCVKVIDFGISKVAAHEGADLTGSGAVVGSPLYMSPEQMKHTKEIDGRSDIWALGVVLYELVTDQVPFEGATFTQIVARVLNDEPRPPSAVRPGLPPWVDEIVMRCLEKKPERRFPSVDALAEALRARGRSSSARGESALADTMPAPPPTPSSSGEQGITPPDARPLRHSTGSGASFSRRSRVLFGAVIGAVILSLGAWWSLDRRKESIVAPQGAPSEASSVGAASSTPGEGLVVVPATAATEVLAVPASQASPPAPPPAPPGSGSSAPGKDIASASPRRTADAPVKSAAPAASVVAASTASAAASAPASPTASAPARREGVF